MYKRQLYRRVARGIDVVADVGRQVEAFVQDASVVDRVVAVAERLDTPAQGLSLIHISSALLESTEAVSISTL